MRISLRNGESVGFRGVWRWVLGWCAFCGLMSDKSAKWGAFWFLVVRGAGFLVGAHFADLCRISLRNGVPFGFFVKRGAGLGLVRILQTFRGYVCEMGAFWFSDESGARFQVGAHFADFSLLSLRNGGPFGFPKSFAMCLRLERFLQTFCA